MPISIRAKKLQSKPSAIMQGHELCGSNPYSLQNPEGYLNFGTAENHLMNSYLLEKINSPIFMEESQIHYNELFGMEETRMSVANFLEKYLNLESIKPENLIIQSGVSAICESLSFAMFDEDDYIMIPTPYYSGFDHDFTKRFGCKFLKVDQLRENHFSLNIDSFITEFNNSTDKKKIKAVLITHPNNPTGEILSQNFMDEMISFCLKNNLDLICDEIYALSCHQKTQHQSLYQRAINSGVRAHLLYGMAKDFAMAGLKVGFYYSNELDILASMKNLSYFHPVSTHTQVLIKNIFEDTYFIDEMISMNQKKLLSTKLIIESELSHLNFLPSEAGLFILFDLSSICKSFDDELKLFNHFLDHYRINMSPGESLGLKIPGFFRVCYAMRKENILEFIHRMKKFSPHEYK